MTADPVKGTNIGDEVGAGIKPPTADQIRDARLTIIDHARDWAEARHLLEACGLTETLEVLGYGGAVDH